MKVKLMGSIRMDFGSSFCVVPLKSEQKGEFRLKHVLLKLKEEKKMSFDSYFDTDLTPKRGTIIIINGADYKIKGGLNAELSESDEIILIPTISGG